MGWRLEVLGRWAVSRDGEPVAMRSNLRLLTFLALHPEGITDRRVLYRHLYPEEMETVAANRLRVALNRLRQLPGPALAEDARGLRLTPEAWTFDWEELQGAVAQVQDHVDEALERAEWETLAPALLAPWSAEEDNGWLHQVRTEWERITSKALRRMAELHANGDPEAASRYAENALARTPADHVVWEVWLRAEHALGRGNAALQRLARAEKEFPELSLELKQTVQRIRSAPAISEESPLAGPLLEVMLTARVDIARSLLSAPETLTFSGANPAEMIKLLARVLNPPAPGDTDWERCMARAIGLWSWQNDVDQVFEHAPTIIGHSTNPVVLRAVWSALSAAHANRGQWSEAHKAIDASLEIAARLEDPIEYLTGLGNKATYLWREGRYAEGRTMHDRSLEGLTKIDSPRALFEATLALANRAFVAAFEGDWLRAREEIEAAILHRQTHFPDLGANLLRPCLVMVRAQLGDRTGLAKALHSALREVFSTGSVRFEQNALEFAAVAISALPGGALLAKTVLNAVGEHRASTGYPRAKCEVELAERVQFKGVLPPTRQQGSLGDLAKELVRFAKSQEGR